MNKIQLNGIIKNIEYSHYIQDIEFYKANLITRRENGKEDIINLKFKKFSNPYKENQEISILGNIRTFNRQEEDRNKVELFVFTYFDEAEESPNNLAYIDGRICKKNNLRKTSSGKDVLDFILANNIENNGQVLNVYLPCVAWGKCAKALNKLNVGDKILIQGQLQSREYKKRLTETDYEIRVCHELSVNTFETLQ